MLAASVSHCTGNDETENWLLHDVGAACFDFVELQYTICCKASCHTVITTFTPLRHHENTPAYARENRIGGQILPASERTNLDFGNCMPLLARMHVIVFFPP